MAIDQSGSQNVLFSAEYDNSALVTGVAEDIKALQALSAEQKTLQSSLDATQTKLNGVQTELAEVTGQLSTLNKSTKDYTAVQSALVAKQDALIKQEADLQTQLTGEKAKLDQVSASAVKASEALSRVAVEQKKIQDQSRNKTEFLFDFGKALNGIQATRAELEATIDGLDFSGFEELQERLLGAKNEFEQLNIVLEEVQNRMKTLDPNTQEYKEMEQVVDSLTETMKGFEGATDGTEKKSVSLRTRIKQLRDELTKLEDQGLDNTKVYRDLELEAARLTDQYGDMQQRIRILASDTKNLDFGLSLANAAGAGFQAYTGILEAFGVSSDTAAEAQRKLLAIMSILQGAQQLQNLLLRENIIRTVGADLAQKGLIATQRIVATVFRTSTAAVRGFSAALLASGVGALIIALGYLISKISEWTDETDKATAAQERLNQQLELQKSFFDADLEAIDNYTALRNEKLKQAGLDEAAIYESNRQGVASKIDRINEELAKLDAQRDDLTFEQQKEISKRQLELITQGEKLKQQAVLDSEKEQTRIATKGREDRKKQSDEYARDLKASNDLLAQVRFELLQRTRTAEQKELAELEAKYEKEKAIIKKAGQDITELTKLYNQQRTDITSKYQKERSEAELKITNELDKLALEAQQKRIDNLTSQFQQETETIKNEAAKQQQELQQDLNQQLNDLLAQRLAGIISPAQYQDYVTALNRIYDQLFTQLGISTSQKLKEVSAKAFQEGIAYIEQLANTQIGNIHISANKEVVDLAGLYTQGKISYEKYQEELTRINQEETLKRLSRTKLELTQQIAAIDIRSNKPGISNEEASNLQTQRDQLAVQLSDVNKQISDATVTQHKTEEDLQAQHLSVMLSMYSNFADSVVGLLKMIDAQEQKRLERQISYQEKRVSFAKQIAEQGNADYLEIEQKRLDELQRQQEEHATRQLAIDQALMASKAALAAIGAVASAVETGSAYTAVVAVLAVIAAIAAAVSFANSFKAPVQSFYEGEENLRLNGRSRGRDTIPANLHEGERIVPQKINQDYFPALTAIQNRRIPAEVINDFAKDYQTRVPNLDFGRLNNATNNYYGSEAASSKQLDNIHDQLILLNANSGVKEDFSLSIDEHGFSLSLMKTLKRIKIQKRV